MESFLCSDFDGEMPFHVVDEATGTASAPIDPAGSSHTLPSTVFDGAVVDDGSFDQFLDAVDDAEWLLDSDEDDEVPHCAPEPDKDQEGDIRGKLADWAVTHQVTHTAVTALLQILHLYMAFLPLDARTLLRSCHDVNIYDKCNGRFVYFGVKTGLMRSLVKYGANVLNDTISLCFGVDGLPLYKSSNKQFWPILAKFGNVPPFLVALYFGEEKPHSAIEYLSEFVQEMKILCDNGIIFQGKKLAVRILTFICDAPARAFMKGTKIHNSYYACDRCTTKGSWDGRVVFTELDAPLRTDKDFADFKYTNHQVSVSPLTSISAELVTSFSLDYLHLVCLGVVRRMLHFWKNGPKKCRLGWKVLDTISCDLVALTDCIPREFARKPRSLKELDRFKATEFRLFLLYTGPVVLKRYLSPHMYTHFMSLSIAMHILLSPTKCVRLCSYARELLRFFVANCEAIYGRIMLVYNVHSLLHLADDVEKFKIPLDKISAFPFENFMQKLKRYVRGSRNPLVQVANRMHEFDLSAMETTLIEQSQIKTNPKNSVFFTAKRDNCYLLLNGDYIFVQDILKISDKQTLMCDLSPAQHTASFFLEPCDSKILNIAVVRNGLKLKRVAIQPDQISCKCLCLGPQDIKGQRVIIPMVDDDS